jgi:hypothetical protein
MPSLCELYPGICLTTEEKARKNLSQGSRKDSKYTKFSFLKKHFLIKYDTQDTVQCQDFGKLFGGRVWCVQRALAMSRHCALCPPALAVT